LVKNVICVLGNIRRSGVMRFIRCTGRLTKNGAPEDAPLDLTDP
jgi:hypothetical protein